jgi:hypothetical protein
MDVDKSFHVHHHAFHQAQIKDSHAIHEKKTASKNVDDVILPA